MPSFFSYTCALGSPQLPQPKLGEVCQHLTHATRSITMISIIVTSLLICPCVTRRTMGSWDIGPQLDLANSSYILLWVRRPCTPRSDWSHHLDACSRVWHAENGTYIVEEGHMPRKLDEMARLSSCSAWDQDHLVECWPSSFESHHPTHACHMKVIWD